MRLTFDAIQDGLLVGKSKDIELRLYFATKVNRRRCRRCILCWGKKIIAIWRRPEKPDWVDGGWLLADILASAKLRRIQRVVPQQWSW